jgi:hypothetical protein
MPEDSCLELLEWAVAVRPFPGEGASGDRHAVVPRPKGALVAVIDALGHGAAAESTARRASDILEHHAHDPLAILIDRCHEALQGDRGVVMCLATIDGTRDTMAWTGVGNISALLLHHAEGRVRRERLVSPAGIVGASLPALKTTSARLWPGDLLMLATDGLREGFGDQVPEEGEDLQRLAERLLLDHATGSDDALVLVARYLGRP